MFDAIRVVADIFTIFASGIAIYLFIFQRHTISSAFKILLSYAWRTTLTELEGNIEGLSRLNTGDPSGKDEAINTISELIGQIRGNQRLRSRWRDLVPKLNAFVNNPERLTEPKKRSLVSELRERLRRLEFEHFEDPGGGYQP